MMQFVRWAKKSGSRFAPVTEQVVYRYFLHCRSNCVPASRLTKCREALTFSKHVIGLEVDPLVLESRRISGAAYTMMQQKPEKKQRDPITVAAVRWAEEFMMSKESHCFEGVAMGYFLLMLHGRVRHSDAMGISEEPKVIEEYLESKTATFKTDKARARRGTCLPIVVPARGVSGLPWAQAYLDLRSSMGLKAAPKEPFMPAMLQSGVWTKNRFSSEDFSALISDMFKQRGFCVGDNLGSHSGKATVLSWCAKYGMVPDDRKLLGGHVIKGDETMHSYSRDSLAGPLQRMMVMYGDVSLGIFLPDVGRGGRFVRASGPHLQTSAPAIDEALQEDHCPSSSSAESSSSDSSPDTAKVLRLLEDKVSKKPDVTHTLRNEVGEIYQHCDRYTFHARPNPEVLKFKCGRAITGRFVQVGHLPRVLVPRCADCFRGSSFDVDSSSSESEAA